MAGIPILLVAGLVGFHLLAAGYTLTIADGAVEAGAAALSAGRPVEPAVRAALPGWARARARVEVSGGRVRLTVRPPSPFEASKALSVSSSAWVRPAPAP